MHGGIGDVVEADHGDIAAGNQTSIDEAKHRPERAKIVVAEHRGGRGRFRPKEHFHRARAALTPARMASATSGLFRKTSDTVAGDTPA